MCLTLGLALAFHDGSVHIVHRLSLQTMAIFYSSTAPRSMDEPAIKRPRTTGPAVHFKAMQLSWTSLALVGIDNHGKVNPVLGAPKLPPGSCVCSHQPKHSARCKEARDIRPELGVACSTDSHRLLAKEKGLVAMGAASQTRGGGPLVVWGSPIRSVCGWSNLHPNPSFPGGNGLHLVTFGRLPLVFGFHVNPGPFPQHLHVGAFPICCSTGLYLCEVLSFPGEACLYLEGSPCPHGFVFIMEPK